MIISQKFSKQFEKKKEPGFFKRLLLQIMYIVEDVTTLVNECKHAVNRTVLYFSWL